MQNTSPEATPRQSPAAANGRAILFVREVPWQSYYPISTRMLAGEFAQDGWRVIWLTPPLLPWHGARNKVGYAELLRQHQQGGLRPCHNVFAYTPRSVVPFSRRFPLNQPVWAEWLWRGCLPPVRRVLRQAGLPEPDVLFIANWTAGGIRRLFPGVPAVFHVTDNYAHFPSSPATCARIQQRNYDRASHIVVTAPSLKTLLVDRFGVAAARITVTTQGVRPARFAGALAEPAALQRCPRPRLVALGNTRWLDHAILAALARAFPEGSVVILGPPTEAIRRLAASQTNIHALGAIAPEEVPAYLVNCDVGLVLFGEHIRAVAQDVCPMKLFEYAAAGLPVVSTPLPVYQTLDVPLWPASTPAAAVAAVYEALQQRHTLRETMRAFAGRHTWRQKYEEIRPVITRLLG